MKIELERIIRYISWFYEQYLIAHFLDEEQYIFTILDDAHPLRLQALAEHEEIKDIAGRILQSRRSTGVTLYAHVLEAHIRFEERELFNYLQEHFSKELENSLSKLMTDPGKPDDAWQDVFWLS